MRELHMLKIVDLSQNKIHNLSKRKEFSLIINGKEELRKLSDMVENSGEDNKIVIAGVAGVGKSRLALEFAHRFVEKEHCALVWWLRANSIMSIKSELLELVEALKLDLNQNSSVSERVNTALTYLNKTSNWLLIYDDAIEYKQLIDYLPSRASKGKILITSREFFEKGTANILQVNPFDDNTAFDFLLKELPENYHQDKEGVKKLAKTLENNPSGLSNAAIYIRSHNYTLEEYTKLYQRMSEKKYQELLSDLGIFNIKTSTGNLSDGETYTLIQHLH